MTLTSDSPASITASRALSLELGGGGVAGFTAQPGFTLTDNGDGTLTISDAQSRLGTKPNAAKPAWFFDFGSGSDQPHPTLSRNQKTVLWNASSSPTTAVARANATHSMTIDCTQADGNNSVFAGLAAEGNADKTLFLDANVGRKYYRYYDVYNDFTYSELVASIQENTTGSSENFKTHRWQTDGAQSTPYTVNTQQANSYRFYFFPQGDAGGDAGDGAGVYDSKLYVSMTDELAAKAWRVEEEYHQISSADSATDAAMYGVLDGVDAFARTSVASHVGLDPTLAANKWSHYKLGNFRYWALPGIAPWRANVLYVDDSWCRVYITDKPTWNAAEQKAMEIQVPTAWDGDVIFFKRNGQFSSLSGKYLWAVDNDDTKILIGGWD